jgi:hypothetical protein
LRGGVRTADEGARTVGEEGTHGSGGRARQGGGTHG